MPSTTHRLALLLLCLCTFAPIARAAEQSPTVEQIVSQEIHPLMGRYTIPGMAVAIITNHSTHVYNFGVAYKATNSPVTNATLFEIGSISKTFTATLAAYAQVTGHLAFSDSASNDLPSLRGTAFDHITLLHLGTHTAGGLPLQVPDDITTNDKLLSYFQHFTPTTTPGTSRLYSNPSIGLLGMITAATMHQPFTTLMQDKILAPLHLQNTYYNIPGDQLLNYAQGYTKADAPIRMAPGVLADEAYGIRTTAADMLRFLQANMHMLPLGDQLQHAITATHTAYYRTGPMTQDLIWEQYPATVGLKDLLDGNSDKIAYHPNPATAINPPTPPQENVLLNKTGSTNGFAAYVAFLPQKKLGIVLLANKNFPIDARVTAAWHILRRLEDDPAKDQRPQQLPP